MKRPERGVVGITALALVGLSDGLRVETLPGCCCREAGTAAANTEGGGWDADGPTSDALANTRWWVSAPVAGRIPGRMPDAITNALLES